MLEIKNTGIKLQRKENIDFQVIRKKCNTRKRSKEKKKRSG